MRRIILSLALGGLVSTSLVACDVEDPFVPGTDTTTPDTTEPGPDTTEPGPDTVTPSGDYQAVIVDDTEYFKDHRVVGTNPCATAGGVDGAHGADIDAVALFSGNTLIGYFDTVRLEIALTGKCPDDFGGASSWPQENTFTDPEDVKGAPQGRLNEGFVSLEGGYVIGEFDDGAYIEPGYTIIVYEVFSNEATKEMFDVYVATDIDCGAGGTSRAGCSVLIGSGKGEQSFNIPMSAF